MLALAFPTPACVPPLLFTRDCPWEHRLCVSTPALSRGSHIPYTVSFLHSSHSHSAAYLCAPGRSSSFTKVEGGFGSLVFFIYIRSTIPFFITRVTFFLIPLLVCSHSRFNHFYIRCLVIPHPHPIKCFLFLAIVFLLPQNATVTYLFKTVTFQTRHKGKIV